jgi:hypothetical protein
MMRIALFIDRGSVDPQLRIVECVTCAWLCDYYDFTHPDKHTTGTKDGAYLEVAIHARAARHGAPRVVMGTRA